VSSKAQLLLLLLLAWVTLSLTSRGVGWLAAAMPASTGWPLQARLHQRLQEQQQMVPETGSSSSSSLVVRAPAAVAACRLMLSSSSSSWCSAVQ
jgi:hypothetical protein